jgi:DNA-binding SARP family transcriptional activator
VAGARSSEGWRKAAHHQPIQLQLLGGFRLFVGVTAVVLPRAERRLLACLALADRPRPRSWAAGQLWPDASETLALGRLRTTLWRLRATSPALVSTPGDVVGLGAAVIDDVHELTVLASHFLEAPTPANEQRLTELAGAGELLPEWDDEWLLPERERVRQLRLDALERFGERLSDQGRFGQAVQIGLSLVADDPLRESARRVLIRAHAGQGNLHDAVAQYHAYRAVMRDELDLEPSPRMEELISELGLAVRT